MRLCHPRWLVESCIALIGLTLSAVLGAACSPELAPLPERRSARGTLGEEVYKSLCRRVAGTELPQDVTGRRSEALCLGDAERVQRALAETPGAGATDALDEAAASQPAPPRLLALAQRRGAIAQAVDDTMTDPLADELEHLFRALLPFYDPPEERVQWATRELATVLERLTDPSDPRVLPGLARVTRKGMLPREGNLGLVRGPLAAPGLRELARSFLPLVSDDVEVRPYFDMLLAGLALELATVEVDAPPDSDLQRLKQLLLRTHPDFGSGKPLFGAVRDTRGLPKPVLRAGQVPFPFVDADGDGSADATGSRLLTAPSFAARLPEPFSTAGEGPVVRDAFDRASGITEQGASDPSRQLYETADADTTLLAGLLRSAGKLFREDSLTRQLSQVSPLIVGEHRPTSQRYGAYDFRYAAPDPVRSPLLDLVHGAGALLDQPALAESLAVSKSLLEDEEATLVEALTPLSTLERRTRAGADAYPEAKLEPGHTFWDELLFELEKLSRRRVSKEGDTLLEAMMRASLGFARNLQKPGAPVEQIVDPELLRHQGVVLATLMRFKDEWRANPTGERSRVPGDPVVLGGFRTPVDRSQPDTPVTCGRDGCGGPIAGTPFERWKKPDQNCMIQRLGRPISGRDCGQRANQSLLHRSLGLIAEMAGRSQCNKAISIGDLLDYAVLKDPCTGSVIPDSPECVALRRQQEADRASSVSSAEDAVRDDYTCPDATVAPTAPCRAYADKYPAAFVDVDGAAGPSPASIQACHMIDLPDVGRTFGAAVTHEFQLQFPNPWVRRYLEDIARAGDHDGDGAPDLPTCKSLNYQIVDPTIAPPCTPEAATLSRDIYKDMPITVDTLGELVEYLLDDSGLFTNEADTADLRPDVKALSRVLFAPSGSTSFILFDPLLVHGAPAACEAAPALPACEANDAAVAPEGGCCIADVKRPPLRYRLDTYYGATSFAWEQPIALRDGKTISFLDTMRALSDAVAQFDFDPARGDDPSAFEDTGYVFSTLGKLIAEHYDSKDNPSVQARDPKAAHYRRLTGLVRYEAMLADALDDGSIALDQPASDGQPLYDPATRYTPEQQLGLVFHALPLVQALDRIALDGGRDAIHVSAQLAELMLSPHARCAGATGDRRVLAGKGACDLSAQGEPGLSPPFRDRAGRDFICWEDGRCFDGSAQPKRFASPLYVLLDAIGSIEDAAAADPARDAALSGVVAGLIDAYATLAEGRLEDRRVRALLLALLDDTRARIVEERASGTLASLPARTDEDWAELLHNPVIAAALGLSSKLEKHPSALSALRRYTFASLDEAGGHASLRPLLAGLFDVVQLLPGDAETNAALRALAGAFTSQAERAVGGQAVELTPQQSVVGRNLYMLRQTAERDTATDSVLERVFANLARVPGGRPSPLEVILDAALEINRVNPGEAITPSADDLRAALVRIAQVLRDERRGFERLYQIVRCTNHAPGEAGCE
jgi:hypothetical protein